MSETRPVISLSAGRGRSPHGHAGIRQPIWVAALLVEFWAGQVAIVASEPFAHAAVRAGYGAASVVFASLAAFLSLGRRPWFLAGNAARGALTGFLLGLAHLFTVGAVAGDGTEIAGWSLGAVSAACLAGTVLGRLVDHLTAPVGAAAGLGVMLSSFVLVNAMSALAFGQTAHPVALDIGAAVVLAASLGVLAGAERGFPIRRKTQAGLPEPFRMLADALPIPVMVTSADHCEIIFANQQAHRRYLVPVARPGARASTDKFYADPDSRAGLAELVMRKGAVEGIEVELCSPEGSTSWALLAAQSLLFDGEPAILTGFYDITERRAAEAALLASEVRYALISRASHDGIWDWDIASGEVYYSTRWREIVGASNDRQFATIDDWYKRVHPDDLPALSQAIADHLAGKSPQLDTEYRIRHGDGRYCWMQCRGIVLRNNLGVPVRMSGSQADITLRKSYEITLRNAAYEDRLTGISNRAFFTQLVESRSDRGLIEDTAIVLLNVDQFRRINDNLGTGAGDALLIAITRRLAARVTREDALARLGADEFAIWLRNIATSADARAFADRLKADLTLPFMLGDVQIQVGMSAGIAVPSLGGATSGGDLLSNARLALDRAKSLGGNDWVLFDNALLRDTKLRQNLSRDLVHAGQDGQIFFEYQPVFTLNPNGVNSIAGFEALMRWRHPELGLIPPSQFIPLAEEAGIIGALGLLAIELAAETIGAWVAKGLCSDGIYVAVNLSLRQVSDSSGVQRLFGLLDRLKLPPGTLRLEITESVLMSDPDALVVICHELRERGVELSLDDFGTGYSSLSYLHRFPFSTIKIDRSFVSRMMRAPEAMRLVRSIIDLGHDLGFNVIAEGVEEAEEAECLRRLSCDFGQGYYFSVPLKPEEVEALLEAQIGRKSA